MQQQLSVSNHALIKSCTSFEPLFVLPTNVHNKIMALTTLLVLLHHQHAQDLSSLVSRQQQQQHDLSLSLSLSLSFLLGFKIAISAKKISVKQI